MKSTKNSFFGNFCRNLVLLLTIFPFWLKHRGDISTLNGGSLKLVDKFTYLKSNVSSMEDDISMWLVKAWTAIDRLSVIWKSELSDKIKLNFCQAAFMCILLYGRTTWTLTRCMKKKLNSNCTRMLYWTNPGSNIPQNSSCTAIYHPSLKPSK